MSAGDVNTASLTVENGLKEKWTKKQQGAVSLLPAGRGTIEIYTVNGNDASKELWVETVRFPEDHPSVAKSRGETQSKLAKLKIEAGNITERGAPIALDISAVKPHEFVENGVYTMVSASVKPRGLITLEEWLKNAQGVDDTAPGAALIERAVTSLYAMFQSLRARKMTSGNLKIQTIGVYDIVDDETMSEQRVFLKRRADVLRQFVSAGDTSAVETGAAPVKKEESAKQAASLPYAAAMLERVFRAPTQFVMLDLNQASTDTFRPEFDILSLLYSISQSTMLNEMTKATVEQEIRAQWTALDKRQNSEWPSTIQTLTFPESHVELETLYKSVYAHYCRTAQVDCFDYVCRNMSDFEFNADVVTVFEEEPQDGVVVENRASPPIGTCILRQTLVKSDTLVGGHYWKTPSLGENVLLYGDVTQTTLSSTSHLLTKRRLWDVELDGKTYTAFALTARNDTTLLSLTKPLAWPTSMNDSDLEKKVVDVLTGDSDPVEVVRAVREDQETDATKCRDAGGDLPPEESQFQKAARKLVAGDFDASPDCFCSGTRARERRSPAHSQSQSRFANRRRRRVNV
jgi:hypothetical protein